MNQALVGYQGEDISKTGMLIPCPLCGYNFTILIWVLFEIQVHDEYRDNFRTTNALQTLYKTFETFLKEGLFWGTWWLFIPTKNFKNCIKKAKKIMASLNIHKFICLERGKILCLQKKKLLKCFFLHEVLTEKKTMKNCKKTEITKELLK